MAARSCRLSMRTGCSTRTRCIGSDPLLRSESQLCVDDSSPPATIERRPVGCLRRGGLRDNVALIAVVGEGAARIEDIIDEPVVGDGSDNTRFVTTTSHANETVDEVLEFAGWWNDGRNQPVQIVRL